VARSGDAPKRAVSLAAIGSAAVVAHNFCGANALAIFYAILVWSFWVTGRGPRMLACVAAAIPLLAYGLTGFWLVPSYLQVTLRNCNTWLGAEMWGQSALAALVAVAFCNGSRRLARGRPERTWAVFTAGAAVLFSLNIRGNSYFNFRVVGEPHSPGSET
jgi:hypothetical protein